MKEFKKPELQIIEFDVEDVITVSGGEFGDQDGGIDLPRI